MTTRNLFSELSDRALIERVAVLARDECHATAHLIAALAELDARRLYLGAGCSSLFTYCTQVLHLSEHAAYGRIEAARLARRFPRLLELLAEGALTLTSVCLLGPVLTEENYERVVDSARHRSKREVEQLVAALHPRAPVPADVRKLPARKPSGIPTKSDALLAQPPVDPDDRPAVTPTPAPRPVVAPLAPLIYKVQFTLSTSGHDLLRRAQALLGHVVANGDIAAVFERALVVLVEDLERRKLAATVSPRQSRAQGAGSRTIPAAVRRTVWRRDGGRCAFKGSEGRCAERGRLEFHHVVPFADGGGATADNIELRCAAHNRYEAELCFGAFEVAREATPAYR